MEKDVFGGYPYKHNKKLINLLNGLVDDNLSPLGKLEKFLQRNEREIKDYRREIKDLKENSNE